MRCLPFRTPSAPWLCALWVVLSLLLPGRSPAADTAPAARTDPTAPPPARVAQLAFTAGGVLRWVDHGPWQPAAVNTPIAARTSLATQPASRAELRLGSAALRLAAQTQAQVWELDDGAVSTELARGSVALRLRALPTGERWTLAAEGARLVAQTAGSYRADFEPRGHRFSVHVLQGQAQFSVGTSHVLLRGGERLTADTKAAAVLERAEHDNNRFDEWSEQRDRRVDRSGALRRLNPEATGGEALDGHGQWRNEPGYGAVWYPDAVGIDWAPFRYGRWLWLAPWGWHWIDDAPWAWPTSHYGRWLFLGGRWGWVPGNASAALAAAGPPVYAPALVAFYGGPAGSSFNPAGGSAAAVGWYPLAPGEAYRPPYAVPAAYLQRINAGVPARAQPAAGQALAAQRYARTSFAVTAVPAPVFHGMQAVAPAQLALEPAALAAAPLPAW